MSFWKRLFHVDRVAPSTGSKGEEYAADYLRSHGYAILDRNWRCPLGEIDLVCSLADELVFVEVKSSERRGPLAPELRVNARKRSKLLQLADYYIKHRHLEMPVRIDVISVWWTNGSPECEHFVNAIGV